MSRGAGFSHSSRMLSANQMVWSLYPIDALASKRGWIVFPQATYGACYWHVGKHLKNWFKSRGANSIFNQAAEAYKLSEFRAKFVELERRYPHVHDYLSNQVDVEKWARALFKSETQL